MGFLQFGSYSTHGTNWEEKSFELRETFVAIPCTLCALRHLDVLVVQEKGTVGRSDKVLHHHHFNNILLNISECQSL